MTHHEIFLCRLFRLFHFELFVHLFKKYLSFQFNFLIKLHFHHFHINFIISQFPTYNTPL
jgi:hypothetical protein